MPEPHVSRSDLSISKATPLDVPAIRSMVDAAYSKYIERIGKLPAPMAADYHQVIREKDVFVLQDQHQMVGSIVLHDDPASSSIIIDNVVVDPTSQGKGYGRVLMDYATDVARSQGRSALTLYTNVKMYENLALYAKIGFMETGRRTEEGFERVYFRKDI
ncbi:hypothetical protein N7468_002121 [Penicillium chermesinum]|uniref:N-acetyltransferase domain-containing protein n=1 Tax=Penicillium chermesinum TaxID=63820 RepID=A0A9W9PK18_9EURO|nr:uncharacterized protein N7468_002121 [Penicillium chermesinum]KAJ5247138.1 hypothetical protein N7468_002121 [Penicillium chermesinum]KAJ6145383.1 hypothetical protein N7470_009278 [Penicillium chermesinum]